MAVGYGAGAPLPPQPGGTEAQRIAKATEKIANATAPLTHEQWVPVTLASGGSQYIQSNAPITMISVQVFTGTVDIVFGDQSGQSDPAIPYFRVASTVPVPVHFPLTTKPHDFTVFANGGAATCSVLLHTPS